MKRGLALASRQFLSTIHHNLQTIQGLRWYKEETQIDSRDIESTGEMFRYRFMHMIYRVNQTSQYKIR